MHKTRITDRVWNSRAGRPLAALTTAGLVTAANAQTATSFDTANLESTATTVLGVGALIAVGFAVFKIGKRAMGKV